MEGRKEKKKGCIRLLCFTKSLGEGKWDLRPANINWHEFQDTCRLQKWERQCFPFLEQEKHGSYSKINTAHLSGAVWWRGVCANIGALQETLRSVCIFSQSDWSKTQPLMYHFKWTPCPNENTHTYKPHLIEGYRFSHSRQFFFFFFFQGGEESTFWNQYSQLVFLQIKAAILWLVSPGTSTERQSGIRTAAVKFYISSRKDWNVILHYLKMTERDRVGVGVGGVREMGKHIYQKGAQMLFLFLNRIGKNIQREE